MFPNASREENQHTLYIMIPTEKNAKGDPLHHQEDSGRGKRGEGAIEDYLVSSERTKRRETTRYLMLRRQMQKGASFVSKC